MSAVALKDEWTARRRLLRIWVDAVLILPVPELPPRCSAGALIQGGTVKFKVSVKPSGEHWSSTFTDEDAMRDWDQAPAFVRMRAPELCGMMLANSVDELYVNPFRGERPTKPGGFLTRTEMRYVAERAIPENQPNRSEGVFLNATGSIRFGPPREALKQAIEQLLIRNAKMLPEVRELYVFQMSLQDGPWHQTIGFATGLALPERDIVPLIQALMKDVKPLLGEDEMIDVLPLKSEWIPIVKKDGKLIYQR